MPATQELMTLARPLTQPAVDFDRFCAWNQNCYTIGDGELAIVAFSILYPTGPGEPRFQPFIERCHCQTGGHTVYGQTGSLSAGPKG